ncbi:kinase-like domain-containing protein [Fusarium sp. MPI-SDFR-AT-0072]|nr:kinase-like domain-containing protein [Fusarium sp. MPI-SDFR-AT-0072]
MSFYSEPIRWKGAIESTPRPASSWECPCDYHPICIGDHLTDRYRVVHKLGYGSFSTIWLARDEIASKYVAVKVGIANSDQWEVDIMRHLSHPSHEFEHYGKGCILPILDHFCVTGPNRNHPCFVTALARCSLRDAQDAANSYMFQLPVARSIAVQMVNAVAYIHSQGLIYKKFGSPKPEPVVRKDGQPLPPGLPNHVYWPIWMAKGGDKLTLSESKILLVDFGTAFYPNRRPRLGGTFEPTTPLSFSADIWNLAHAIWAVGTLGRLPDEWWNKWDARSRWFMDDGSHKNGGSPEKLDGRFVSSIQDPRRKSCMEIREGRESHAFKEVIRWMLSYRPSDRPTAEQLLNIDWTKFWAITEFENSHK